MGLDPNGCFLYRQLHHIQESSIIYPQRLMKRPQHQSLHTSFSILFDKHSGEHPYGQGFVSLQLQYRQLRFAVQYPVWVFFSFHQGQHIEVLVKEMNVLPC